MTLTDLRLSRVIQGPMEKHGELIRRAAAGIAWGLLLGRVRFLGAFSPFGVAWAASARRGKEGLFAALGAAAGYLLNFGPLGALRYCAAILLIRWAIYVLRGTELGGRRLFAPVCALIASGTLGLVHALDSGWAPVPTALFITESFAAGGCTYFFRGAVGKDRGETCRLFGMSVLAACVLAGCAQPLFFGAVSPGRTLALMAVLAVTLKGSLSAGCTAGAVLGTAMDLTFGTPGVYAAGYALCAGVCGVFRRSGRLVFLLAFTAVNALWVIRAYNLTADLGPLYEGFSAAVLLMPLPDGVLNRVGAFLPDREPDSSSAAAQYTRQRLMQVTRGFRVLLDTAKSLGTQRADADNPSLVYDGAADAVCRSCPRRDLCWQRDSFETYDALNGLTEKLRQQGGCGPEDLPRYFRERCRRTELLIAEINSRARTLRLRRQFSRRLSQGLDAAMNLYSRTSEVLSALARPEEAARDQNTERKLRQELAARGLEGTVSALRLRGGRLRIEALCQAEDLAGLLSRACGLELEELPEPGPEGRRIFTQAPPVHISFGTAAASREAVSGDRCLFFRTDGGTVYAAVADGMGTGQGAAEISSAVAGALESFLRSGVEPQCALGLTESMLFLKNEEATESTALDLFWVDPFTGQAGLCKYGGAATFIARGSRLRTIRGQGFPAGLTEPDLRPEPYRFRFPADSVAVLVSDGVTDALPAEALGAIILSHRAARACDLAKLILSNALRGGNPRDDMTVLVVKSSSADE